MKQFNWAPILSLIIPGTGQIGKYEYAKGYTILFIYLILISLAISANPHLFWLILAVILAVGSSIETIVEYVD
mgnify:CR=1 FL=1